MLYVTEIDIYPACTSEQNSKCLMFKIIILIILNEQGWHYLTVKQLSAILR